MKIELQHLLLWMGLLLGIWSCGDKCADTSCPSNRVCNEGKCECPQGYSGPDCDNRLKPASVTIKEIKLVDYCRTNRFGQAWDTGTGADTLPDIKIEVGLPQFTSAVNTLRTPVVENFAYSMLPYTYSLMTPYVIHELDQFWEVRLYNENNTSMDLMGTVEFMPYYMASSDYPTHLTLKASRYSCPYEIVLTVDWQFY
jgi:hypothetical protein